MAGAHIDHEKVRGQPNGLCPLDLNSLVPVANLPNTLHTMLFPVGAPNTNYNGYRTRSRGTNQNWNFSFHVPVEYDPTTALLGFVVGAPTGGAAGPNKDIDLTLNWALFNQSVTLNTAADVSTLYDFSGLADTWQLLNFSSLLTGVSPGAFCGLEVDHMGIGGTMQYLGVVLGWLSK